MAGMPQSSGFGTAIDSTYTPRFFNRIPETDGPSSMPREDRRTLYEVGKWIREQYDMSLAYRTRSARGWIGTRSIMEGYHYFFIDDFGVWRKVGPRKGEIRAFTNLMRSRYNREHGRLLDNSITYNAVPRSAKSGSAIYKADGAKIIMNSWLDEIDMPMIWDEFIQHHLIYGMSWLYRYVDRIEKQVRLEAVPGPELFPVPYYETSDQKLDGLIRGKIVTRQWVEDNVPEAVDKVGRGVATLGDRSMFITHDAGMWNNSYDGALALWFWFKRSKSLPKGFAGIMIEDEIYRYSFNDGVIPGEMSRYHQQSSRWHGVSMCENQIAPQMEHNRQYTDILKSGAFNKGRLLVNRNAMDLNELRDSDQVVVTIDDDSYSDDKPPYYYLPPQRVSADVGAIMMLAEQDSRRAVGHESDIIMGQQEGRTESGPATERLNTNASSPLIPCVRRMSNCLKRTGGPALDMIRATWDHQKTMAIVGPENLPEELHLQNENQWPTSTDVMLYPGPILPMGRSEMINMLYAMKQMKGDDGSGPEISSAEFRRALRMANQIPDGLDSVDEEEQRIVQRMRALYNDGQRPGFDSTSRSLLDILKYENHVKAIRLLKNRILHPAFTDPQITSPVVQKAFVNLLEFHGKAMGGDEFALGGMGLEGEEAAGRGMAQALDMQEQDLYSTDGKMTENGLLVGV